MPVTSRLDVGITPGVNRTYDYEAIRKGLNHVGRGEDEAAILSSFDKGRYTFISRWLDNVEAGKVAANKLINTPQTEKSAYLDIIDMGDAYVKNAPEVLHGKTGHIPTQKAREMGDDPHKFMGDIWLSEEYSKEAKQKFFKHIARLQAAKQTQKMNDQLLALEKFAEVKIKDLDRRGTIPGTLSSMYYSMANGVQMQMQLYNIITEGSEMAVQIKNEQERLAYHEPTGMVDKLLNDIASNIPIMGAAILPHFIAPGAVGSILGMAAMGTPMGTDTYLELLGRGVDKDVAVFAGVGVGLVGAAIEMFLGNVTSRVIGGHAYRSARLQALRGALSGEGVGSAGKLLRKLNAKKPDMKFLGDVMKTVVGRETTKRGVVSAMSREALNEALTGTGEEWLQTLFELVVSEAVLQRADLEPMIPRKKDGSYDYPKAITLLNEAAIAGFFLEGLLGGGMLAANVKTKLQQAKFMTNTRKMLADMKISLPDGADIILRDYSDETLDFIARSMVIETAVGDQKLLKRKKGKEPTIEEYKKVRTTALINAIQRVEKNKLLSVYLDHANADITKLSDDHAVMRVNGKDLILVSSNKLIDPETGEEAAAMYFGELGKTSYEMGISHKLWKELRKKGMTKNIIAIASYKGSTLSHEVMHDVIESLPQGQRGVVLQDLFSDSSLGSVVEERASEAFEKYSRYRKGKPIKSAFLDVLAGAEVHFKGTDASPWARRRSLFAQTTAAMKNPKRGINVDKLVSPTATPEAAPAISGIGGTPTQSTPTRTPVDLSVEGDFDVVGGTKTRGEWKARIREVLGIDAGRYNVFEAEKYVDAAHANVSSNFGAEMETYLESLKAEAVEKRKGEQAGETPLAQRKQIDTPEFKAWFKDSKVVDENGEPLVVYHGTNKDFDAFSRSKAGTGAIRRVSELAGKYVDVGLFFTPEPGAAEAYAYHAADVTGSNYAADNPDDFPGANIKPVYISMQNPLYQDYDTVFDEGGLTALGNLDLELKGYDGVIRTSEGRIVEIIPFSETQVKSSIGNTGAFSPTESSMRAQSLRNKKVGRVINSKNYKAVGRQEGNIDITRKTKGMHYGNPFSHLARSSAKVKASTSDESVRMFRRWLAGKEYQDIEPARRKWILSQLQAGALEGKRLVCSGHSGLCHGDVLVSASDSFTKPQEAAGAPVAKQWARYASKGQGYEVSSAGDKRFSAFNAKLADGRSIEEHYQVDVKGYPSIKEGKGKPPKDTSIDTYEAYKNLWRQWAAQNMELMRDLYTKSKGKTLTDKFASTKVSQARALAEILNELGSTPTPAQATKGAVSSVGVAQVISKPLPKATKGKKGKKKAIPARELLVTGEWYTPNLLRSHPDAAFLFGDNLLGTGKQGQATIRDEKNAYGIPTKKRPSRDAGSYFTDEELEQNKKAIDDAINKIPPGMNIVVPAAGLGTGLAQLQERAPMTWDYLQSAIQRLDASGGTPVWAAQQLIIEEQKKQAKEAAVAKKLKRDRISKKYYDELVALYKDRDQKLNEYILPDLVGKKGYTEAEEAYLIKQQNALFRTGAIYPPMKGSPEVALHKKLSKQIEHITHLITYEKNRDEPLSKQGLIMLAREIRKYGKVDSTSDDAHSLKKLIEFAERGDYRIWTPKMQAEAQTMFDTALDKLRKTGQLTDFELKAFVEAQAAIMMRPFTQGVEFAKIMDNVLSVIKAMNIKALTTVNLQDKVAGGEVQPPRPFPRETQKKYENMTPEQKVQYQKDITVGKAPDGGRAYEEQRQSSEIYSETIETTENISPDISIRVRDKKVDAHAPLSHAGKAHQKLSTHKLKILFPMTAEAYHDIFDPIFLGTDIEVVPRSDFDDHMLRIGVPRSDFDDHMLRIGHAELDLDSREKIGEMNELTRIFGPSWPILFEIQYILDKNPGKAPVLEEAIAPVTAAFRATRKFVDSLEKDGRKIAIPDILKASAAFATVNTGSNQWILKTIADTSVSLPDKSAILAHQIVAYFNLIKGLPSDGSVVLFSEFGQEHERPVDDFGVHEEEIMANEAASKIQREIIDGEARNVTGDDIAQTDTQDVRLMFKTTPTAENAARIFIRDFIELINAHLSTSEFDSTKKIYQTNKGKDSTAGAATSGFWLITSALNRKGSETALSLFKTLDVEHVIGYLLNRTYNRLSDTEGYFNRVEMKYKALLNAPLSIASEAEAYLKEFLELENPLGLEIEGEAKEVAGMGKAIEDKLDAMKQSRNKVLERDRKGLAGALKEVADYLEKNLDLAKHDPEMKAAINEIRDEQNYLEKSKKRFAQAKSNPSVRAALSIGLDKFHDSINSQRDVFHQKIQTNAMLLQEEYNKIFDLDPMHRMRSILALGFKIAVGTRLKSGKSITETQELAREYSTATIFAAEALNFENPDLSLSETARLITKRIGELRNKKTLTRDENANLAKWEYYLSVLPKAAEIVHSTSKYGTAINKFLTKRYRKIVEQQKEALQLDERYMGTPEANWIPRIYVLDQSTEELGDSLMHTQTGRMLERKWQDIGEAVDNGKVLQYDNFIDAFTAGSHQIVNAKSNAELLQGNYASGFFRTAGEEGYIKIKGEGAKVKAYVVEGEEYATYEEARRVASKRNLEIKHRLLDVYAPADYANIINRQTSPSAIRESGLGAGVMAVNAKLKAIRIAWGMFHRRAFIWSAMMAGPVSEEMRFKPSDFVHGGQLWKKLVDRFDYPSRRQLGMDLIRQFDQDLYAYIHHGATEFRIQDIGRASQQYVTGVGKFMAGAERGMPVKLANQLLTKFQKVTNVLQSELFGIFGSSLKSAMMFKEGQNLLNKHKDAITREKMASQEAYNKKKRDKNSKYVAAHVLSYRKAFPEKTHAPLETKDFHSDTEVKILRSVAGLANADFGGEHLKRLGISATNMDIMRLLFLGPDWTMSNVRSVLKLWPGGDPTKNALYNPTKALSGVGTLTAHSDIEKALYRHFWLRITGRAMALTLAINLLMAGLDDEGILERLAKARKRGKFKMLMADISPVIHMLGGDEMTDHYLNLTGHFLDPAKMAVDPVRMFYHKSSTVLKPVLDLLSGTRYDHKRPTSIGQIGSKGLYTWKENKRGPLSPSEVPAYAIFQFIQTLPIQFRNIFELFEGESNVITGLLKAILGLDTKQTYDKFNKGTSERNK